MVRSNPMRSKRAKNRLLWLKVVFFAICSKLLLLLCRFGIVFHRWACTDRISVPVCVSTRFTGGQRSYTTVDLGDRHACSWVQGRSHSPTRSCTVWGAFISGLLFVSILPSTMSCASDRIENLALKNRSRSSFV